MRRPVHHRTKNKKKAKTAAPRNEKAFKKTLHDQMMNKRKTATPSNVVLRQKIFRKVFSIWIYHSLLLDERKNYETFQNIHLSEVTTKRQGIIHRIHDILVLIFDIRHILSSIFR